MKRLTIFLFFIIVLCSLAYAAPPFIADTSTSITGLQIEYPLKFYIQQNNFQKFHFHIFNATTGAPITLVDNCTFHLYNNQDSHIFVTNTSAFSNTYDIEILVNESNFTNTGYYSYLFQCQRGVHGGFVTFDFIVTRDGLEETTDELTFIIGLGIILAIFIMFTIMSQNTNSYLYNFFFLSTFIITTIMASFINRIAYLNANEYAGLTFLIYRVMLWVTMTLIFITLTVITIDAFKMRKMKNNSMDDYKDNLGK